LTELDLTFNHFGVEGARYIGEALRHNTTLTQLNLTANGIEDEGAQYLSQALQYNTVKSTKFY